MNSFMVSADVVLARWLKMDAEKIRVFLTGSERRVSDIKQAMCQSGPPSTGGRRVEFWCDGQATVAARRWASNSTAVFGSAGNCRTVAC
jgi:hypothetical protein